VLQSAAELIPIPLLKDALGVAIKVIEICQVSNSVLGGHKADQYVDLGGDTR